MTGGDGGGAVLRMAPSAESLIPFNRKVTSDTQQNWFSYAVQLTTTRGKEGWVQWKATKDPTIFLIEKMSEWWARICWLSNLENNTKHKRLSTLPNSRIRAKGLAIHHHWPETSTAVPTGHCHWLPCLNHVRALALTPPTGKDRALSELYYRLLQIQHSHLKPLKNLKL